MNAPLFGSGTGTLPSKERNPPVVMLHSSGGFGGTSRMDQTQSQYLDRA
jgi:hypothetical protein